MGALLLIQASSSFAEPVPDAIRETWQLKQGKVELLWDDSGKALTIRLLEKRALIDAPGGAFDLGYEVTFESALPESTVLLRLGADGKPTWIRELGDSTKTANPKVAIINPHGIMVGNPVPFADGVVAPPVPK